MRMTGVVIRGGRKARGRGEEGERKERSLWAGEYRQEEEFDASLEGESIRKRRE